jgi:hypothetical protein
MKHVFLRVSDSQPDTRRFIFGFILALTLVRGIIYAAVIPPWQAPDEPAQFERAKAALTAEDWNRTTQIPPTWYGDLRDSLLIYQFLNYTLPRLQNDPDAPLNYYIDLYHEVYGGTYGNRLTFAVIGTPIFLAQYQNITLQLYFVRLGTVLMSVAIIFLAYLIACTIFPKSNFLALGVPIFIMFNPQHTYSFSTVNNGNMAELLATVALYFIARGFKQNLSLPFFGLALAFALMAIWTKATTYFLFFTFGSVALFFLWRYRRHWRWVLFSTVLLCSLIFLLTPQRLSLLLSEAWPLLSQTQFYFDPQVVSDMFKSFWAMPGWAILRLDPVWYQVWLITCILSIGGLVALLVRHRRSLLTNQFQPQVHTLLVFGLSVGVAIAIQVGWHILTGTTLYRQGRSLYPLIVPIAIFLMLGWRQLMPVAWQNPGLLAVTIALFLFDAMVLFDYIIPFFYSRY